MLFCPEWILHSLATTHKGKQCSKQNSESPPTFTLNKYTLAHIQTHALMTHLQLSVTASSNHNHTLNTTTNSSCSHLSITM